MHEYGYNNSCIENQKKYMIDISMMINQMSARKDYALHFEIILLDLCKLDNIEFCVSSDEIDNCKNVFYYLFDEYKDIGEVIEKNIQSKLNRSIAEYTHDEITELMKNFSANLFGHNEFKIDLHKQLKVFGTLNRMKRDKIFSILLCGNSGIGKTEVARLLHSILYSDGKVIKLNFGNYTGQGSLWSLIGSPKGYKGSEEGGELTNKIKKSTSKVILIDEFEKADKSIYTFFYELLEDGTYTDLDENEVDLNGYIIIFTTNLTSETYRDKIPEPLMSRFDMTYEFLDLKHQEKLEFVKFIVSGLIKDYKEINSDKNMDNIYTELIKTSVKDLNDLREIKRIITMKFAELVE